MNSALKLKGTKPQGPNASYGPWELISGSGATGCEYSSGDGPRLTDGRLARGTSHTSKALDLLTDV
jgi:hypothetical protein